MFDSIFVPLDTHVSSGISIFPSLSYLFSFLIDSPVSVVELPFRSRIIRNVQFLSKGITRLSHRFCFERNSYPGRDKYYVCYMLCVRVKLDDKNEKRFACRAVRENSFDAILIHLSSIEHLNVNELRIRVYISYFIRFSRHQREPQLRFEHDDFSLSPISHSRYTSLYGMEIQNTTLHGKHHFIFYIQIRFNLFVEQVPYKLFFTIFNRYIRPIYFLSSRA